jgi:hypothetical protein
MSSIQTTQSVQVVDSTVNNVGRDQNNITINEDRTDERTLETLKPAERSGYYVPGCMPATRESIFAQIDIWLKRASSYNPLADLSPIWQIHRHRE